MVLVPGDLNVTDEAKDIFYFMGRWYSEDTVSALGGIWSGFTYSEEAGMDLGLPDWNHPIRDWLANLAELFGLVGDIAVKIFVGIGVALILWVILKIIFVIFRRKKRISGSKSKSWKTGYKNKRHRRR